MKKDGATWKGFEKHCQRKQDDNETRVAQMKNVLENKFEDDKNFNFQSPLLKYINRNFETANRKHRNKLQTHNESIWNINSDRNIPSLKDNFKRVEYQKVWNLSKEESKIDIKIDESVVYGDKLGNLSVSRANNPFQATTAFSESRDFLSSRRGTNTNIMKEVDKSQDLYSDYSESDGFDSEIEEESLQNGEFNAKKMPCLQSICRKIWKKPK